MSSPLGVWEYYISDQVHSRAESMYNENTYNVQLACSSINKVENAYLFSDKSFLMMSYSNQVSLQDAIDYYKSEGGNTMSEELTVFYTIQLIHVVQCLLQSNVIHGSIIPDKLLLRNE